MTTNPSRFDSLQVFRGLAALAVVYNHLHVIAPRFLSFNYNGPWAAQGDLGVDFFFVLSGFIITWIHGSDLGHADRLASYLLKRVIRIYPLAWLVVSVKVLAGLLVPALNVSGKDGLRTIAASFILFPNEQYVIDVQWTLACEVIFYIVFGFWILAGKKIALVSGAIWAAALVILTYGFPQIRIGFLLAERNLEFLGGCVTAFIVSKSFLTARSAAALMLIALFMAVVGLAFNLKDRLFWSCACSALIASSVSLDSSRSIHWPRWAVYLGDASYSIYLVHTSVQMLIALIGKRLGFPFQAAGQLLFQITGVISILAGLACHRWVEKPLSRALGQWLQRKSLLNQAQGIVR